MDEKGIKVYLIVIRRLLELADGHEAYRCSAIIKAFLNFINNNQRYWKLQDIVVGYILKLAGLSPLFCESLSQK